MKNIQKNCLGFTLIELLVVVLIIGILSAIAFPQYQKSVERSRAAEAVQNIQIIKRNIDLYLLNNGFPSSSSTRLYLKDLQNMGGGLLQGGEWPENRVGWYVTRNFEYSASCGSWGCSVEVTRSNDAYYYTLYAYMENSGSNPSWVSQCYTQMHENGRAICKALEKQGFNYTDAEM